MTELNAATPAPDGALCLAEAAAPSPAKIVNPASLELHGGVRAEAPVLVVLAAGRGTRFGQDPKCIQPVHGTPLARHSIDAFRRFTPAPVVCIVGYRHQEVTAALGSDNVYVLSANPTGGTAFAAFEAFSVEELAALNAPLMITMGDRIVPSSVFRRLWETHIAGEKEADITFLTAVYEPPKNRGKGRVLRGRNGRVVRIVEDRDIALVEDELGRQALANLTEGNCPLYVVRAETLRRYARSLTNANAQRQYYLTDIIEGIGRDGGDIRTITTTINEPEYDLLCSDVTQPMDLALLEGILASSRGLLFPEEIEVQETARVLAEGRPVGQVASIARQMRELLAAANREKLGYRPDRPVGIGVSGGRLRIAFMHPDMVRFYGPAWQMPIGAGDASGTEQIVVFTQSAEDRRIHLYPLEQRYRESVNFIPSDTDAMYPDEGVSSPGAYEVFGTRMSERLLLSLGYFSDEELDRRRAADIPLPPPMLWVGNSMRRPFSLVGNAIASMRTLRAGSLGAKVQECLGRRHFTGLRMVSTGSIPQGGFSSSSAMTVATKNALNALFRIGIPPDLLVHLACQAEYGTGVRAGSLDQATEQKGRAGQGTLISSNPRENYRVLGTFPVPADRFRIVFPYSVDRDRAAWRWSWGAYSEIAGSGAPTTGEARKMTGKAAEIAALLLRLPFETDFFQVIEDDLMTSGTLGPASRAWVAKTLRAVPLLATQEELRCAVAANRQWYIEQIAEAERLDHGSATAKADATIEALFSGWRDPALRRATANGVVEERGAPLRAMLAYLFGEVAKNFGMLHHPEEWIACVQRSQRGDRSFQIDPERLPPGEELKRPFEWERGSSGPDLLNLWLERHGAVPFDFNRGLDDASLDAPEPPDFSCLEGASFFRGLALIDLAEAMLRRAFGPDAVAVRVNAAGQGDYFQVHVDTERAKPAEVQAFISAAFYRRFGLTPSPEFVELHPGGGAAGARLNRYDTLPQLIRALEVMSGASAD
jgi:GTP:adenosylcobinamide-phosphate guanylyltransferase